MKRKNIIWIVVIVLVVLVGYKLFVNKKAINEKNAPEAPKEVSIPVLADTVAFRDSGTTLKKTGNLAPFKQAIVYTASTVNVEQLYFELGTNVKQGQLLAITDTRKLNIDLQNAIVTERKLKNDLQTYNELLEGKATTQEKVNQISLDYTDAKNQTQLIRKQLTDTKVKAPISGVVTEKVVEQGVFVNARTNIATIVDLQKAKVQVYLTETEVYQVKQRDTVSISTDVYPDRKFKGIVSYISPQADATHSYLVEIFVANPQESALRSGTFVYGSFSKKAAKPSLSIPREALIENVQEPTVYVIENNRSVLRKIKTGSDIGDYVEVLDGLKNGEIVVTSGQINLKDRAAVAVSKNNKK